MLILFVITTVVYSQSCSSQYFNTTLNTAKGISSVYCKGANLSNSSCCTNSQVDDFKKNMADVSTRLDTGFTLLWSMFEAKRQQELLNITNLNTTEQESIIEFATLYSSIDAGSIIFFEGIQDFQDFSEAMLFEMDEGLQNWETCRYTVLSHEAGRQCEQCNPIFLKNFSNSTNIEISLDVCINFMRDCFSYIDSRIILAKYVNVINVILALTKNKQLALQLVQGTETFAQKNQFAQIMQQVKIDSFTLPNQCSDQFDCRFICNQFIDPFGLKYFTILNPTNQPYNPSFARILEMLEIVQQEKQRRRMLTIQNATYKENTQNSKVNLTQARRKLIFYVQDFTSPLKVSYTFSGPNTITIGQTSGLIQKQTSFKYLIASSLVILWVLF